MIKTPSTEGFSTPRLYQGYSLTPNQCEALRMTCFWLATMHRHCNQSSSDQHQPQDISDKKRTMGLLSDSAIVDRACADNVGNIFLLSRVSDPDIHHGSCMTHVLWCLPGSLSNGFLWSRWWGKRSQHSWHMRNLQFYVSGNRPMLTFSPPSHHHRYSPWHPISVGHNMTD